MSQSTVSLSSDIKIDCFIDNNFVLVCSAAREDSQEQLLGEWAAGPQVQAGTVHIQYNTVHIVHITYSPQSA